MAKWDRILKMVMSSKINDTQFLHSKKGFSEKTIFIPILLICPRSLIFLTTSGHWVSPSMGHR